ncbi:MAG: alpha-1,2-fucosyltransferase [Verrucomicrobiaceae bacterium]|nr:MAG: alpha-1,2-fucosyltransferase [Verrucomicrobiaceae bacterium]
MIRVVMLGRLGNNLFQYALGRELAEIHQVPLVMDASWFNAEGWGQVECIRRLPGIAEGKAQVVRRCSLGARALRKATGKHYWQYRGVPMLREDEADQSYNSTFLAAPADCLLFGYFQSPLYFRNSAQRLRQELSTDGLGLEAGREELAAQLAAPGSVAIHVRRSDYIGNPNLDLCGRDYYRKAIARMREMVEGARFFAFSDDPAAAATVLDDPAVHMVTSPPQLSPLADLHMMKLAQHHIIANSTYSWWAAWLGEKPGQHVLMPRRWFAEIHAPIEEKRWHGWQIVE